MFINLTNLYFCVFYCQKTLLSMFTFFSLMSCVLKLPLFFRIWISLLSSHSVHIPSNVTDLLSTARRTERGVGGKQLGDFKKQCHFPPWCAGFIIKAQTGAKYHHTAMKPLWHSNRVELAEIRRKYDEKKWRILPLNPLLLYSSQRFQLEMMHSSSVRKIFALMS